MSEDTVPRIVKMAHANRLLNQSAHNGRTSSEGTSMEGFTPWAALVGGTLIGSYDPDGGASAIHSDTPKEVT